MKTISNTVLAVFTSLFIFLSLTVTSVQAKPIQTIIGGAGIAVDGDGIVTVSILETFRLPQNCEVDQVTAWDGVKWNCANDGLSLPFSASGTWNERGFSLTNSGAGATLVAVNEGMGMAGVFAIENLDNTNDVLLIKGGHSGAALNSVVEGTGSAGQFSINNPANSSPTLNISTYGSGNAIDVFTAGTGRAISAGANNSSPALVAWNDGMGQAAAFEVTNENNEEAALLIKAGNKGPAFHANMGGAGTAGYFSISNPDNTSSVLNLSTNGGGNVIDATGGAGWVAYFTTVTGKGLNISVPTGNPGLSIVGGSKSSVVATTAKPRLLYTEESTEVWFTDYGFGQLVNGVAQVTIDPLFAQTVNLNQPYHVFVQPYGDAKLYVTNLTNTGFEVRTSDPSDVGFSYRIVAKRLGFEGFRLEEAGWGEFDPNL